MPSHRVAYMAFHGVELTPSEVVRHTCDNPICCNPDHLVLGSQADNVRDMVERGRQQDYSGSLKGSDHHGATIDEATALSIFKDAGKLIDIASKHGVSKGIVERIRYGSAWNHVTGLPHRRKVHRT